MHQEVHKIARVLTLLGSVAGLSGCLEDMGSTRFTTPPTAVAAGLEFTDKNMGPLVGGTIKIAPAQDGQTDFDAWTFDSYVLRWGHDGEPIPSSLGGVSSYIGRVERSSQPLEFNFTTMPPQSANSIIVYTDNAIGSATEGRYINFENVIIDPRVPSAAARPEFYKFTDGYHSIRIAGTLIFRKPPAYTKCNESSCQEITATEADITKYVVRFADDNGCPFPGPAVAEVNKNSTGIYYVSIGYDKTLLPSAEMTTMAMIPANQYGEAYSESCEYAHTLTRINDILPSRFPHYVASSVTLSADTDDTDSLSATIDITRALDERDLLTGYYISWGYSSHSGDLHQLRYFPKNGNNHQLTLTNWVPTVNGTTYDIERISFFVSTGQENWEGAHVKEFKLGNNNRTVEGNWFLINLNNEHESQTTQYCIRADALNADLKKATCNKYDVSQRFDVVNANFAGNDDMHYIRSVQFPNQCFYRADDAGAPNWRLFNCDNTWNMRVEIKGNNSHADYRMNKKIAVNSGSSWTCLAHYSVNNDLSSPWGNCGLITPQIFQRFLKIGRPSDFGYFND